MIPASTGVPPTSANALSLEEQGTGVTLPYFEVGVGKFVALSVVTWGVYDLYWAYQQWIRIESRSSENLSPFWRAFFANFWGFSLFKRIRADAVAHGVPVDWDSGFLGFVYLVLVALWRLPAPWWLISLFSFLPIVPVVQVVAALHDRIAVGRDRNDRVSGVNIAGLVVGGLFLVLALVGTFAK